MSDGKREVEDGEFERWQFFFEPLAVKAVSEVAARLSKDGKLYGYDGIEAARAIRDMLADAMLRARTQS